MPVPCIVLRTSCEFLPLICAKAQHRETFELSLQQPTTTGK